MTNNTMVSVNVNEVLGHMAKVEFKPKNGYRMATMEGKIIYSFHNASLFFMPKNARNRGYIIEKESDIKSVEIIRKNMKENATLIELYSRHDEAVALLEERYKREQKEYQKRQQQRQEAFENKRKQEQEAKEKQKNEATSLVSDYEAFENEVIEFYEKSGEAYSIESVKSFIIPMLAKIVYKGIDDISVFKKHFFDKKGNPRFCKLLEMKTGVKLANTQKKNIEILNAYLKS